MEMDRTLLKENGLSTTKWICHGQVKLLRLGYHGAELPLSEEVREDPTPSPQAGPYVSACAQTTTGEDTSLLMSPKNK